jgi:hypothetical protein
VDAAGQRAAGTIGAAETRARSNERINTEREDGKNMRHDDKIAVARENIEFLKSKAVAEIEARIQNQDTRNLFGVVREKIRAFSPLNESETKLYDDVLAAVRERGGRTPHAYINPTVGTVAPAPAAPAAAPAAPAAAPPAAGAAVAPAAADAAAGMVLSTPPTEPARPGHKWQQNKAGTQWRQVPQ